MITRTLEGPPAQAATQWTTRSLADVAGLSKATISRVWQTFGLQSHRLDTFKLSADPRRFVFRLLAWNPWQAVFLRGFDQLREPLRR